MNNYNFKCLTCGNEFNIVYSSFFDGKCNKCKSDDLVLIVKQSIKVGELLKEKLKLELYKVYKEGEIISGFDWMSVDLYDFEKDIIDENVNLSNIERVVTRQFFKKPNGEDLIDAVLSYAIKLKNGLIVNVSVFISYDFILKNKVIFNYEIYFYDKDDEILI